MLVWGVWAVMLVVALLAIAKYGPQIPRAEDWLLVPPLTGHEPNLAAWLWEQNSEHRVPLPRLSYLALLEVTGGDFRAGMVFNTLALTGLAAAMMLAARRLRGRATYADAFFPLAFLHLGHWDNLVWSWQIQFVLSTLFASVLLLIVVIHGADLTSRSATLAGSCLVALPLCGANGLVLVPFLAAWLAFAAFRASERAPAARLTAFILSTSVAAALVLTGGYFVGYEPSSWYPATPSTGATLKTAVQLLAMAFGPGAAVSWRASVAATLTVVALTMLLLAGRIRGGTARERSRALGLICLLVAMLLLTLAMGWGRAGRIATGGLSRRYALLTVPVLCITFFAWQLYGPRRWAAGVQAALLIVAVALIPANTAKGLEARDWVQSGMDAVRRDIATGMPLPLLAERHHPFLLHWDGDRLAAGMRMLREARIGPFAGLRDDFAIEQVRLPASATTDDRLQLALPLGEPRRVYAIRLALLHSAASPTAARVRLAWQGKERGARLEPVPTPRLDGPEPRMATVWINDVLDGFRIESDDPVALDDLRALLILVPSRSFP